jgi:hypothetical protein
MTEKKAERRHGTVARQHKAAETDRVAKEFIEAERTARRKQMEKLQELRLAQEATEAAEAEAAKAVAPAPRKRRARSS